MTTSLSHSPPPLTPLARRGAGGEGFSRGCEHGITRGHQSFDHRHHFKDSRRAEISAATTVAFLSPGPSQSMSSSLWICIKCPA